MEELNLNQPDRGYEGEFVFQPITRESTLEFISRVDMLLPFIYFPRLK